MRNTRQKLVVQNPGIMAKRKQEEVAKDMESVKVSHTETDPAPKASPEKTKDLAAVS